MSSFYLKWADPNRGEQTFVLDSDQLLIGRRSECEIAISDPYVSRRHANLIRTQDGYLLRDLKSMHGTFVNGTRIEEHALSHGDRIHLGENHVELLYLRSDSRGMGGLITTDSDLDRSFRDLTAVLPGSGSNYSDLEKLSYLLDFQYNWGQSFSADKTFQQILKSALRISGAERGFILLKEDEDFNYVLGMDHQGKLLSESEFQTSQSVVQKAARQGRSVVMTEGIDQEFAQQQSIMSMQLRAVACMPLQWISPDSEESVVKGILYLDSTKRMHTLSGLDEQILNKLAVEAASAFERLEMVKTVEERRLFERELSLARETQRSLLPQSIPDNPAFRIAAFSQPTRHVGGDFYDFVETECGRLITVVADVSGKGISAALLSSLLQGALETAFLSQIPLHRAAKDVNGFLCERSQANRFVTLFLFTLDSSGQGHYLSAGHNPAYLFRAREQKIEELGSEDLILGAFDFAEYHDHPLHLNSGDLLLVYTDGLTEAMNPEGAMFGEERLAELVRTHGASGGENLKDLVLAAVEDFTTGMPQTDDMTLVIVERV